MGHFPLKRNPINTDSAHDLAAHINAKNPHPQYLLRTETPSGGDDASALVNTHNGSAAAHETLFEGKADVGHKHKPEDIGAATENHTHPGLEPMIFSYNSYLDEKSTKRTNGCVLPELTKDHLYKEIIICYALSTSISYPFTIVAAANNDFMLSGNRCLVADNGTELIKTIRLMGILVPVSKTETVLTWALLGGVNTWVESNNVPADITDDILFPKIQW